MEISIVTTTFNSEDTILLFLRKIRDEMQSNRINKYEIIVVDDGSGDNTRKILLREKSKNRDLKLYFLSRNFGHHLALLEGIKRSKGSWIFMIDSDLEENPSNFTRLIREKHQFTDVEIFETIVSQLDKSWINRKIGQTFWILLNYVSNGNIAINMGTTRLFSGRARDAIIMINESYPFIPTIFRYVGFKKKVVHINKTYKGKSNYTFERKLSLLLDAFLSEGLGFMRKVVLSCFVFSLIVFSAMISFVSYNLVNNVDFDLIMIMCFVFLFVTLGSWNLTFFTILIVLRIRDELIIRPKIVMDKAK